MQKLFVVKSLEIAKNLYLEILFDKEMNLDENIECYFRIKVDLDENNRYQLTKKFRYVYEDVMVSIESIQKFILEMFKEIKIALEAIDKGINLTKEFYSEGLKEDFIEIDSDLKESIENINEYNIQPYIIDLYTSVIAHYKGTDTLQKRKYEKMIEAQEDALKYVRSGGRGITWRC